MFSSGVCMSNESRPLPLDLEVATLSYSDSFFIAAPGMATHVTLSAAAFLLLLLLLLPFSFSISHSHRSAAINLFAPAPAPASLQDAYEALRVFEILGIEEKKTHEDTCQSVLQNLASSSSLGDLFYALKVNGVLKCSVDGKVFKDIATRLKTTVHVSTTLLDIYYSVGGLVLVKDQDSNVDVVLADVDGVFQSIKALSQRDGRWCHIFDNPESSIYAAGLALESLAGLISLASSEIDQSKVNIVKNDIVKLFDGIEKYDDGSFYFDEKFVGGHEQHDPLSTTSSVVRGVTAFAAVTSGKIDLPEDKILGLAKFFLGIGIPEDAKDFFNQVQSLAFLESNRISIPLILSLPETVYSLTKKGQLKVKVNTALGSAAPPLTVKLVRAFSTGAKNSAIIDSKELRYDQESGFHVLDAFLKNVDVGTYVFIFEIVLHDSGSEKVYATGGQIHVPISVTGIIEVGNVEITVLDGDLGSSETKKKLDLAGNDAVSLSANHLQKLRFSFQLATPLGHAFKPHQAFFKLRHETKVEHIFVVGNSGKKFEIILTRCERINMEGRVDGRFNVMEGRLETVEIAVDGIKVETGALHQDTVAIRQELKEIMRMLGGRRHQTEDSQSSVNANVQQDENEGGRRIGKHEHPPNWRKRVELPTFEGPDPLNWINRADRFFDLQGVEEDDEKL
ncbi:hypothetical protein VNO78_21942 [Psophocarpus tetragonolobus]|uniref:Dolichyl-diphosphooligosaccharide--protein glycosyltransferase subunit 2 n=1 Tax=Psophocarpus tetragonolobus TaxID=3891 RepID=A0AAN9SBQ1_PSOTE